MGWLFNRQESATPTQQFGASNSFGMAPATGMMGGYGGMQGQQQAGMMDPMQMQIMGQNPMMQQMANDPVIATSRLLQYYDPVSAHIVSANFPMVMDLISEVMMMSLKDFFSNVKLTTGEDGKISLDPLSLPTNLATLSAENLALTLQRVQGSAQQQLQFNQQQTQMLLQAHNPMVNNQQGFFGNLVGGLLGQQMQNAGGMSGMGMAGAALL